MEHDCYGGSADRDDALTRVVTTRAAEQVFCSLLQGAHSLGPLANLSTRKSEWSN